MIAAEITKVKIGNEEIEGLMWLEEGKDKFGVAVVQACVRFQFSKIHASRDLKAILGENTQFTKMKTKLNPKAVDVLLLQDFEKLLFELALKRNEEAIKFSRALIGLSLQQLFSDAFNIEFEKQDRQAWLIERQEGKEVRRTLTDSIKEYTDKFYIPEDKKKWVYVNVTDAINIAVFNRTASKLRKDWDIANPRDVMSKKELIFIKEMEGLVMRLIDKGWKPVEAVKEAEIRLLIPKQNR